RADRHHIPQQRERQRDQREEGQEREVRHPARQPVPGLRLVTPDGLDQVIDGRPAHPPRLHQPPGPVLHRPDPPGQARPHAPDLPGPSRVYALASASGLARTYTHLTSPGAYARLWFPDAHAHLERYLARTLTWGWPGRTGPPGGRAPRRRGGGRSRAARRRSSRGRSAG